MEKQKINIAIVGLGYVGLPLAVELSKKYDVTGYDLDKTRVDELKSGIDKIDTFRSNNKKVLKKIKFTHSLKSIKSSNVYIITVPTPVDKSNKPDLNPLISASRQISRVLSRNDIVIYESTVFPGCTEEICVPILEEISSLKYNSEFFCGYSPERINPGDNEHSLINVIKVTSGSNDKTAKFVDELYKDIIPAGTHLVSSIKVAEAAKVIENTQRDVNIALMNELAIIFNKLGIDTNEVLDAAGTKWNFIPFKPGLVGGHCIGVDPYYLTHKALELGYHPEVILAGRRINDNMANFIFENIVSMLSRKGVNPLKTDIGILGLTFKEDCSDLRNTKVINIIQLLQNHNYNIDVSDYEADENQVKKMFNINLIDKKDIENKDVLILAVAHKEYWNLSADEIIKMLKPNGLLIDIKSIFPKDYFSKREIQHWRL